MNRIRVAIAVADDALDRLADVVAACRALGFRADSTLTGVGIVTGFAETEILQALRAVPGVAALEIDGEPRIHLPPHHSN